MELLASCVMWQVLDVMVLPLTGHSGMHAVCGQLTLF
jgi:hypothetical protein